MIKKIYDAFRFCICADSLLYSIVPVRYYSIYQSYPFTNSGFVKTFYKQFNKLVYETDFSDFGKHILYTVYKQFTKPVYERDFSDYGKHSF